MLSSRFEGVFSLLLTPFNSDQSIDWPAYHRYVEWQLSHQPKGLFAVCGSSEMKWLTLEERLQLAQRAQEIAGDIPVVATANLNPDPQQHAQEMEQMAQTGVAGLVLVPPPGMGRDQQKLGDYFADLLDHSPSPTLIYEWPLIDPYLIDAEVVARLQQHGLVGIKDTTCTPEGIAEKIRLAPNIVVYQANTPFLLEAVEAGARGIMSIATACHGDLVQATWQAARSNPRSPEAQHLHSLLVVLDSLLVRGYPATAKIFLQQRGLEFGLTCRWPLQLTPEVYKIMKVAQQHVFSPIWS
jgi:4-hydroxy-tetrahydrodipicolinate synthase